MQPIRFACPACGGNIKAPGGQPGEEVECPRCQQRVAIPGERPSAAPVSEPVPPPANEGKRPPAAESQQRPVPAPRPPHAPSAPTPARRPQPEKEKPSPAPREPEFAIRCPVCATSVAAPESKIGQHIQCPDCHSEILVQRKEAPPPRFPSPTSDDDDVPINMSAPVATPRVVPAAVVGIEAADLFGDDDAIPDAPPTAGGAVPPAKKHFAVVCPVCTTRALVPAELEGQEIRCSDCHSEFTVVAPREKAAKPGPRSVDVEEDFRLSDVVERPKYRPMTRGTARPGELESVARPGSPASAAAPTGAPLAAQAEEVFFFACPTCGTQLNARPSQVGSQLTCGDCHTAATVPKPAARRKKQTVVEDTGGEVAIEGVSAVSPMIRPVDAPAPKKSKPPAAKLSPEARATMEKALQEQSAKQTRDTLASLPYLSRVFGVLSEAAILQRGMMVAMGVCFVLSLMALAWWLMEQENQILFVVALIPLQAAIAFPTMLYWANTYMTIVQDTSNGSTKIEGWEDDLYIDLLSQLFLLAVAFMAAISPGAVCSLALTSFGLPPVWVPIGLALSLFVFFPITLLSILEEGHFWSMVSPAVIKSLGSARRAWLQFYAESFAVLFLASVLVVFAFHPWIVVRAPVSVGLIVCSFLYARVMGLAAAKASLAFAGESMMEVEEADADES